MISLGYADCRGLKIRSGDLSLFNFHHLAGFDFLMNFEGGETFRRNRKRSVVKFSLKSEEGKERIFHLKRHKTSIRERLKGYFSPGNIQDGENEWKMIFEMEKYGIPTTPLVAFGIRQNLFSRETLTVTEHLYDTERLEELIPRLFSSGTQLVEISFKRKLIESVALLSRKFHGEGFCHNDFYLGHFFVKLNPLTVYLIDLQRVEKHRNLSRYKRVKDIAQLVFSSTQIRGLGMKDYIIFLRHYFGVKKLDAGVKKFIRQVLKKTERISSHTKKLVERVRLDRARTGYW